MVSYLTPEGLKKLKKELDWLQNVRRKEVSERIRHTASQGDLKENAGYHMAKEEQSFVEGRISELKGILAQAKTVEKKAGGKVQIGSIVFLQSANGKEKFQLVGPEEADILKGKVSFKSPLGEAIFNRKKGDSVNVETGEGQKTYKIVGVE